MSHLAQADPENRVNDDWERDEDGRIIEYGVVRLPDAVLVSICRTEEIARGRVAGSYLWKAQRRREAEANRAELDAAPPLPATNQPWMNWERGQLGDPPIKDMEWEVRKRTCSDWEPLYQPPAVAVDPTKGPK